MREDSGGGQSDDSKIHLLRNIFRDDGDMMVWSNFSTCCVYVMYTSTCMYGGRTLLHSFATHLGTAVHSGTLFLSRDWDM